MSDPLKNFPTRHEKTIRRVVGGCLLFFILFFMFRMIRHEWERIIAYDWHPQWAFLGLSSVLMMAVYFLAVLCWALILRKLNEPISYKTALRIYIPSLLGRYLPGGVWFVAGRVYLSRLMGLSKGAAGMGTLMEQTYSLAAAIILGAALLWAWDGRISGVPLFPVLFILPLFLIFLHPVPFMKILNPVLRRLGRPVYHFDLRYRDVLLLAGYYLFFWFVFGLAFFFFVRSFYPVDSDALMILVGINAVAFVAGYLAFVTPMGLGVRDMVCFLMLKMIMPDHVAVGVVLMYRFYVTLVDVLAIGMAFFSREVRGMVKESVSRSSSR